jgi:hypothetical protein
LVESDAKLFFSSKKPGRLRGVTTPLLEFPSPARRGVRGEVKKALSAEFLFVP